MVIPFAVEAQSRTQAKQLRNAVSDNVLVFAESQILAEKQTTKLVRRRPKGLSKWPQPMSRMFHDFPAIFLK